MGTDQFSTAAASDHSVLVRFGDEISLRASARVRSFLKRFRAEGVRNLHPAYTSVLISFDPLRATHARIEEAARAAAREAEPETPGRLVEIPVVYGGEFGPDLADLAALHSMTPDEAAAIHASAEYIVYFVGFSPGFPYLGGLPESIAAPRLSSPRKCVPAGSVAIGGNQAGIYPLASPGGWRIIGRTPLELFRADRQPPALLEAGDRVRFVPAAARGARFNVPCPHSCGHPGVATSGEAARTSARATPVIRVEAPGLLTTVQDLGRPGYAHLGVSASGAADALALRVANLLVGNPENAPALEMTLTGGAFTFDEETVVALTGSPFGGPLWRPFIVRAGQTLRLGPTSGGARCYLAVRGGIGAPRVLGSASTHVLSGVGGRPLKHGDALKAGPAPARAPLWRGVSFTEDRLRPLRVTTGPQSDWFHQVLDGRSYEVKEESNRMGLRLRGPKLELAAPREMITEGVSLGAIQIPPDGEPVILFVEHQTTGGYPKIANVISADLWRVGQLRPRDAVRFESVTVEAALELLAAQEAWIRGLA